MLVYIIFFYKSNKGSFCISTIQYEFISLFARACFLFNVKLVNA